MVNNITDSYAIGEVFDGDAGYACDYQLNGLDGFLNFPVYFLVPLQTPNLILMIDDIGILFHGVNSNASFPQCSLGYLVQL